MIPPLCRPVYEKVVHDPRLKWTLAICFVALCLFSARKRIIALLETAPRENIAHLELAQKQSCARFQQKLSGLLTFIQENPSLNHIFKQQVSLHRNHIALPRDTSPEFDPENPYNTLLKVGLANLRSEHYLKETVHFIRTHKEVWIPFCEAVKAAPLEIKDRLIELFPEIV